jgi:benzoylformate decarboxylase
MAPDAERLRLFADRISASRSPALVFGPEVDRAGGWDAAIALAEKLRASVFGARCRTVRPSRRTTPSSAGRSGCR